jgi:bifunctional non-homologous end joining protein LigD
LKTFQIAGVELTNPERVFFPRLGVTKRQLAEYYAGIAGWILPFVAGRPVTLVRCPAGRRKCFYQKHYDESFPQPVQRIPVVEKDGEQADYIQVEDLAGIIGLVQIGALELHPWGSRAAALERPDQLIFDLDPAAGLAWKEVVAAAFQVRERLAGLDLRSFVKTSGGKGLHVVVPLEPRRDWQAASDFAQTFARELAAAEPGRFVANARKARRAGKIFIDYLRNVRGATNVAAYSTRARPGAPVSTPLRWDELAALESAQVYTLENVPRRLAALGGDPWEGFFELGQSIPAK